MIYDLSFLINCLSSPARSALNKPTSTMGVYGASAQPSPPRNAAFTILQSSTQMRSRRGRDGSSIGWRQIGLSWMSWDHGMHML